MDKERDIGINLLRGFAIFGLSVNVFAFLLMAIGAAVDKNILFTIFFGLISCYFIYLAVKRPENSNRYLYSMFPTIPIIGYEWYISLNTDSHTPMFATICLVYATIVLFFTRGKIIR